MGASVSCNSLSAVERVLSRLAKFNREKCILQRMKKLHFVWCPSGCIVSSVHLQMFDWTIWGEIAKAHTLRLAIRLPNGLTFNAMLPFQHLAPPRGIWFASIKPAEILLYCLQAGKLFPPTTLSINAKPRGTSFRQAWFLLLSFRQKAEMRKSCVEMTVKCGLPACSLSLCKSLLQKFVLSAANDPNKWISDTEVFKTDQHQPKT